MTLLLLDGTAIQGKGLKVTANLRIEADDLSGLPPAFVATDESLANPHYRAALAAAAPDSTVMTRTLSGRPARSLPTRFTALTASVADRDVPAYPLAYDLAKALHAVASAKGEGGFGAQWAGEGAHAVRSMPAAQLIVRLSAELDAAR